MRFETATIPGNRAGAARRPAVPAALRTLALGLALASALGASCGIGRAQGAGQAQSAPAPVIAPAVLAEIKQLVDARKLDDAGKTIERNWADLMRAGPQRSGAVVLAYADESLRQKRHDKASAVLLKTLQASPSWQNPDLQTPRGWVYDRLQDSLLAQKRYGEAQSWAKVRFAVCGFEESSVTDAVASLSRAFLAEKPTAETVAELKAALSPPAGAFSSEFWKRIPYPAMDDKLAIQLSAPDASDAVRCHDVVVWRLAHGHFAGAVAAVLDGTGQGWQPPVTELCRILKAYEGGVGRPNALLASLSGGQEPAALLAVWNELKQAAEARDAAIEAKEAAATQAAAPIPAATVPAMTTTASAATPPAAGAAPAVAPPTVPAPAKKETLSSWMQEISKRDIPAVIAFLRSPKTPRPAPISAREVGYAPLMAGLAGGQITASDAWDRQLLNEADLFVLLESDRWFADKKLGETVTSLAVRRAPQRLAQPRKLSANARGRLGGYLLTLRDERAIPLFQATVDEFREKNPGKVVIVPGMVELALAYEAVGDYRSAAAVFLDQKETITDATLRGASAMHAAKLYERLGEWDKAEKLLMEVPQYGYGWGTGFSYLDRGRMLLRQGKHEEARRVMSLPVTGSWGEHSLVMLYAEQAVSYYETAEWKEARSYANKALAAYEALPKPLPYQLDGHGIEPALSKARKVLVWLDRWEKQDADILCQPTEIFRRVREPLDKPLRWQVAVRSFKQAQATLNCADKRLQIRLVSVDGVQAARLPKPGAVEQIEEDEIVATQPARDVVVIGGQQPGGKPAAGKPQAAKADEVKADLFHVSIFEVTLPVAAQGKKLETTLEARSATFPAWRMEIPLKFEIAPRLEVAAASEHSARQLPLEKAAP